jgi:hypothetical protein
MSLKDLNLAPVANKGQVLHLKNPGDGTELFDADKKPVTITLLGKDSDVFVKADNIKQNKMVEAAKRGAKYSAAQMREENEAIMARCTTGWSGIPKCWVEGKGEDETPAEFTFENAVALYHNIGWVFEQADNFVGDRANFLTASS